MTAARHMQQDQGSLRERLKGVGECRVARGHTGEAVDSSRAEGEVHQHAEEGAGTGRHLQQQLCKCAKHPPRGDVCREGFGRGVSATEAPKHPATAADDHSDWGDVQ